MPGLFVKIFIWFWATVVLTCLSLVLAIALQPHGVDPAGIAALRMPTKYYGTAAVGVLKQSGAPAATCLLDQLSTDTHVRACLFDDKGLVLAGWDCEEFKRDVDRVAHGVPSAGSMHRGLGRDRDPGKECRRQHLYLRVRAFVGPGRRIWG